MSSLCAEPGPHILVTGLRPPPDAIPLFMSEIEAMGGAERSILALGRWLSAHGKPVFLLTYYDRVEIARRADFQLPVVVLNPPASAQAKIAALKRFVAEQQAKLPAPITSGYQPALHCALAGIGRFHCLMHDTPSLFAGPDLRLQQRIRLAFSNWQIGRGIRRGGGSMIVTSEYLKEQCLRDFHIHAEIARMGGMVTPGAFHRRPLNGELRILSVCRIEANKRIDWMLNSLAALEQDAQPLSSRVDWRLELAGSGADLEVMRQYAAKLGLDDRVRFLGFVPDAELEVLYAQAHLFLMPAIQGYGIPAIEALGRGIPVLLHRESGVSDLLLDTPWATVLTGGEEQMTPGLRTMIEWLLSGGQLTAPPPPELPTENSWAERVATLCGYV